MFTEYLLHARPVRRWLVSTHGHSFMEELSGAGVGTVPGDRSYCGIQEGRDLSQVTTHTLAAV